MTATRGMKFIGLPERLKQAKSALNRLRWEVTYAAEARPSATFALDMTEFGELAAIFEAIVKDVDNLAPEGSDLRRMLNDSIGWHLEFYRDYHEVQR